MSKSTPAVTFPLAGRPVRRVGYGAMQLAGPAYSGRRRTVPPRSPYFAKPWPWASITSIPATSTVRMSPTSSFAKHSTLIRTTWPSSPRSAPSGATTVRGLRHSSRQISSVASMTTFATSASMCSTSSTCESWATSTPPSEGSIEKQVTALAETSAPRTRAPHRPEQRHLDADRRGAAPCGDRLCAEPLQPGPASRRRAGRRARGQRHRLRAVLSAGWIHADSVIGAVGDRSAPSARHRCRWRSPGSCIAHPTSC